jgi:hypothetical protein
LIAERVGHADPKHTEDDPQVDEGHEEESDLFIAQERGLQQGLRGQQDDRAECSNREVIAHEEDREDAGDRRQGTGPWDASS